MVPAQRQVEDNKQHRPEDLRADIPSAVDLRLLAAVPVLRLVIPEPADQAEVLLVAIPAHRAAGIRVPKVAIPGLQEAIPALQADIRARAARRWLQRDRKLSRIGPINSSSTRRKNATRNSWMRLMIACSLLPAIRKSQSCSPAF
jgi:hypothetical protein